MDNLSDLFKDNRKALIFFIAIYVIVTVGIIIYIWKPKEKDYLQYDNIDINDKQLSVSQQYLTQLSELFRGREKGELMELISDEYISFSGKSKEDIVSELDNQGYFSFYTVLKGMSVFADGYTYIYTTKLYKSSSTNEYIDLNIIEKEPYQYELAFENFYSYAKPNKNIKKENINFTIQSVYNNLKYIKFEIDIENLNNTYVRFSFNDVASVQAVLEDGKSYLLSNPVSTSEYVDIEEGTTIKKEFVFEIPAQLQDKIDYIVFNNVKFDFSKSNIRISI